MDDALYDDLPPDDDEDEALYADLDASAENLQSKEVGRLGLVSWQGNC